MRAAALTAREIEGGQVRFEGNVVGDDRKR